jgi:hypothetical protein
MQIQRQARYSSRQPCTSFSLLITCHSVRTKRPNRPVPRPTNFFGHGLPTRSKTPQIFITTAHVEKPSPPYMPRWEFNLSLSMGLGPYDRKFSVEVSLHENSLLGVLKWLAPMPNGLFRAGGWI